MRSLSYLIFLIRNHENGQFCSQTRNILEFVPSEMFIWKVSKWDVVSCVTVVPRMEFFCFLFFFFYSAFVKLWQENPTIGISMAYKKLGPKSVITLYLGLKCHF